MTSTKTRALLLLLFLGIIWGSGYTIARYAMTHGVPPAGYTFWQALGPALILSALCWRKLRFDVPHCIFYLVCGIIGIVIPNTNMYYASPHLPAGLLAVLVNTVPLIIYPLALMTGQEKFNGWRLAGVGVAIIGLMILVLPKASLPSLAQARWSLLALLTPLCFALFAIFINPWRPAKSTPLSLAAGMLLAATLILTPWVKITGEFYALHWPLSIPDKLILLEMGLSSLGYVIFFWLLRTAGPVYYSMVDSVVALTGIFWGQWVFHETFSVLTLVAMLLLVSGILLVTTLQKAAMNSQPEVQ